MIERRAQQRVLDGLLQGVRVSTEPKPGRVLLVRGRRRVGKSSLVQQFVSRGDVPHLYYAAAGRPVQDELRLFAHEVAGSNLPGADLFDDVELTTWDAALRLLAATFPDTGCVVVLDGLPALIARDDGFAGSLQRAFDRYLSGRRCLVIGIGSDDAAMSDLAADGGPLHRRTEEMVLPPMTPAEVGELMGLSAPEAFDAALITGGLPLICEEWPAGQSPSDYLAAAVSNPTSALLVSAERALAAEFPADAQARHVLGTVGGGARTFAKIGRASGDIPQSSLNRSLNLLQDRRLVIADQPLSTRSSTKDKRYRVADPYLGFWLQFLGPYVDEIERGRGDRVLARIRTSWTSWRDRAIQPVLHEALGRLAPPAARTAEGLPGVVGGYWTRTNEPEIDIVVVDRAPTAERILAVGSISWRDDRPFDDHDLGMLLARRAQLPGAGRDTGLIVVSRSGCTVDGITCLDPEDLMAAWPAGA